MEPERNSNGITTARLKVRRTVAACSPLPAAPALILALLLVFSVAACLPEEEAGGSGAADSIDGTEEAATEESGGDEEETVEALEILGSYTEAAYGGETAHQITADSWSTTADYGSYLYHILDFDNGRDYLVTSNDEENEYSGGLFSRFDWSTFEGGLYYCQSAYAAGSAEEADASDGAVRTDPPAGGCGLPDADFPWSLLEPVAGGQ